MISMPEEILEQGVVIETDDGTATVAVIRSGSCDECAARSLCGNSKSDAPQVTAVDLLGVKPGDRVRVSAPGKNVLLAAVYLYGIPLVLLLAGIALCAAVFATNAELWGSIAGVSLCALYYLVIRISSRAYGQSRRFMPHIDRIL